jgi:putative ABC transport system permease protein
MFGIIVGVASVIVIIGITQGVKNEITNQVNAYSKDVITITSTAGNSSSFGVSQVAAVSVLTNQDVRSVSKIKGVIASVPLEFLSGVAKGDKSYPSGLVIATTPQLPEVINQPLVLGAFFSPNDPNPFAAVLGYKASLGLFNQNVPPLGYGFTWHNQQFIVSGVLNRFKATPFSNNTLYNEAIFIPTAAMTQLSINSSGIYQILARVKHAKDLPVVAKKIETVLLANHGGQKNFSVLLPSQVAKSSTSVLNLLAALTIGIAVIALFVGGVGIMNVMLVSVTERMHEIGIRKAIGASNRQIMSQFLIEAATVSVAGGLIGIVLALLVDFGLKLATSLSPSISWKVIALGAVISMAIGIVFGSVPALRAAGKEPIEALRNE